MHEENWWKQLFKLVIIVVASMISWLFLEGIAMVLCHSFNKGVWIGLRDSGLMLLFFLAMSLIVVKKSAFYPWSFVGAIMTPLITAVLFAALRTWLPGGTLVWWIALLVACTLVLSVFLQRTFFPSVK